MAVGERLRRVLGLGSLALLCLAALLHPVWVWGPDPAPARALREGAGSWLPLWLGVGLGGALAGVLVARSGRLPAWGPRIDSARGVEVVLALLAGLAVGALAAFAFAGKPVHVDGVVQAFQARVLRGGAVAAPAPPLEEFFVTLNAAFEDGRWLGQFPPGFPLLLALVGPGAGRIVLYGVLAAIAVYALFRAGAAIYGRGVGLLAAALFGLSPFTLLLSASGLSHAAAAAAAVLAFWLATGTPAAGRAIRLAGCGVVLGALIAIRPLDGLLVSACVLPCAVRPGGSHWRSSLRSGVWAVVGLLPPLVLFALYNHATTGSATELGYARVWGSAHGLGFHPSPWGEPHTLARGLSHLHADLWLLNPHAFGSALPLLPLVAVPWLLGAGGRGAGGRRRDDQAAAGAPAARGPAPAELCLYALVVALPAAYVFYWHHDWFLGPRYLFTVFPFFCLLTARGTALLARAAGPRAPLRAACLGVLAGGAMWLAAVELPGRLGAAFAMRPDFRVDVAHEAREQGIERGVIFVKESWGSRLLARLRARGLSSTEAERSYRTADHCALEGILREPGAGRRELLAAIAADVRQTPPAVADPRRNGDPSLRLRPGTALAAECRAEIAYDLAAPYGIFTPQLGLLDPWLREPVVVARDLGAADARLLAALNRGPGYLYVPGRGGSGGTFLPLESFRRALEKAGERRFANPVHPRDSVIPATGG